MIRIHNIRVDIKENIDIYELVSKKLQVNKSKIKKAIIHKKSLDARNKKYFAYVYEIDVDIENEQKYLNKDITLVTDEVYILPKSGDIPLKQRPIIIGAGPAGLFCAYELAKKGYNPLVIERGEQVEDRIKTVNELWENNIFKSNSNIQFGEGGAGTFSDGKLNTLVKNRENRMKEVFKIFVECGAPEEIMYEKMPHIGTDILRQVIVNLRNKIISFGGEIRYNSLMEDILIENNKVIGIVVNNKVIGADILVLAIGHSARDTFKLIHEKGIFLEPKPFAMGIRVMHNQNKINENQYPINYSFLPPASYKLTYTTKSGRGVYSFCMCPGGYVVNSRSTENGIVVNGMSNYKRDSGIANSAIVVSINPNDYGNSLFAGLHIQEQIEQKAYELTGGVIPIQYYGDYKNNKESKIIKTTGIKGFYKSTNINEIFPDYINSSLKEGIEYFGTKIKGFNNSDTIIVAPETRTSSPIRIVRNEMLESNILGIYPAGEGAGYAGGITTSAIDGVKIAEKIIIKYKVVSK